MTKRLILALAGLLAASMIIAACDDEPTQQEANEQFCDDTAEFIASLRVIRDLDADSTIDDVEEARERAREAFENMVESSAGVTEARLDDLEDAYDELRRAVDDIDDESTVGDALESVDDELEEVAVATALIYNDVNCGGANGGSLSDE